jgi:hypothetical protein
MLLSDSFAHKHTKKRKLALEWEMLLQAHTHQDILSRPSSRIFDYRPSLYFWVVLSVITLPKWAFAGADPDIYRSVPALIQFLS